VEDAIPEEGAFEVKGLGYQEGEAVSPIHTV
jgi:hypothetical protein